MNILQPSRLTFWRFIFLVSLALPSLSIWRSIVLARSMEIDVFSRPSWIGLLVILFVMGMIPLLFWTLTWSRHNERILAFAGSHEKIPEWLGWPLLSASIIGYTLTYTFPFFRNLFGGESWIRLYVFWLFCLAGIYAFKSLSKTSWFTAMVAVALMQTCFHLLAVQLSYVANYPFAMGWSETSRYYYPSLFLSNVIYGQKYTWPVLHPTLHLLLTPPYWFSAPLWVHRLWQVLSRLVWVAAIVPAMLKRLSVKEKTVQWLVGAGMFLFLFMGPIYFHLAVPVIILLYGFSIRNDRRNWLVILLASLWCGWSRVNWYPMPGVIAAVLYLLETPYRGKTFWQYVWKPASWVIVGTGIALASQRAYIALSGLPSAYFYSSFSSNLLWYRLWPNASYSLGMLPAALLASLPIWIVLYAALRGRMNGWHGTRLFFLFIVLLVLFAGGLFVSLKIGGGADLHNMDAYFVVLLIMVGYVLFAQYRKEDETFESPVSLHWGLIVLMLLLPTWTQLETNAGLKTYNAARTSAVLSALQDQVDQVNAQGGDILFISQRHLISMGMLQNVKLVYEYEREDLMEMAMARNETYLAEFRSDMEDQRFAAIIVDPLNYSIYSRRREFSDENNVWASEVIRSILCNYRLDVSYPEDNIAIYVPQDGERQCP